MLDFKEKIVHGNPGYPIAFYRIDKSHARYVMNFHWHPEFELIRILEGNLSLRIGSELFEAQKGELFFLSGGAFHSAEPRDCIYECIVFDIGALMPERDICRGELRDLLEGSAMPINPLRADSLLYAVCEKLFESASNEKESPLNVKGNMFSFLGEFSKRLEILCKRAPTSGKRSRSERALQRVSEYIEKNYAESITLDALAACAYMTPNYFCRFFKKMTGSSPISYLVSYRIERACTLLSTTDMTVTEVALACGFGDISYFINSFKKQTGCTPLKYKSRRGGDRI